MDQAKNTATTFDVLRDRAKGAWRIKVIRSICLLALGLVITCCLISWALSVLLGITFNASSIASRIVVALCMLIAAMVSMIWPLYHCFLGPAATFTVYRDRIVRKKSRGPLVVVNSGAVTRRCGKCDSELSDKAAFCHRCGAPV